MVGYSLKGVFSLALGAILMVGVGTTNAQWMNKNDVDLGAGFLNDVQLVIGGSVAPNHVRDGEVSLDLKDTTRSYDVILKAYGPQGINSNPLFVKLMNESYGGRFYSDFKNPKDPKFILPSGTGTLVAEVYFLTDGPPIVGFTNYGTILAANGILPPDGSSQYLQARKQGTFVLDYGVKSFRYFKSSFVEGSVSVTVTPQYRRRVTLAQRRSLDAKALALANSVVSGAANVMNTFSPTLPAPTWKASILNGMPGVGSPGIKRTAYVDGKPVAADNVSSFLSKVASQARTQTVAHPEGSLLLIVTTQQRFLQ